MYPCTLTYLGVKVVEHSVEEYRLIPLTLHVLPGTYRVPHHALPGTHGVPDHALPGTHGVPDHALPGADFPS